MQAELKKKKDFYNSEVAPVVSDLLKKCRIQKIPCFMTFCINEEDEVFESEMISPSSIGLQISKNDYISECIKIINGFRATASAAPILNMKDLVDDSEPDIFNEIKKTVPTKEHVTLEKEKDFEPKFLVE